MLKLVRGRRAVGTFLKSDSLPTVEILGLCGLDFAVLDAEHAPFDRAAMDRMLLAARAAALPMLVRVVDQRDATILSALDLGASGIIVPHVDSADQALNVLAAARFIGGRRGISLAPRFAGYGTRSRAEAVAEADQALVICQIESAEALTQVDEIAAIQGLGGLLIGRADLALSFGLLDANAPLVLDAARRIAAAGATYRCPILLACANVEEVAQLEVLAADAFIIGSDQSLLRDSAMRLAAARTALRGAISEH